MFPRKKKQEVIVTAIDLSREDPVFSAFDILSEDEKLDVLRVKIQFICEAMSQKHPDAQWIIGWREYGIMGKEGNRTVSREFKNKLKEILQKFVTQHHNLTIIAGTIAVEKQLTPAKRSSNEKVSKIQRSYQDILDIHNVEDSSPDNNPVLRQVKKHSDQFKNLMAAGKEFTVIRNTCYIAVFKKLYFSQDKALIFKRHKSAPYEETKEEQVFYPGGNENRGSVFRIANNINIAAEICREHYLGMVSWRNIGEDILIHFVLSDSVLLRPEHFQGKYVIQLDSHHKPRLFVTNEEQFKHINVELYRVNGLESDNKLTGPYEESKIFVIRVVDEIDKMLRLTGNEEKKRLLQGIRREVMKRSQGVYSINLHEYLEKQFTDKESVGIILQKEFSMFSVLSAQSTEQGLTDSIKIILRLLYEEKIKNPQHHEHTSRDETAGLKKT